MINVISRHNISEFPVVVPALQRAFFKTDLGTFWDFEALFAHTLNHETFVFHQVESGYAGVIQFIYCPKGKILHFFWSGKHPDNEVDVDYSEIDVFLTEVAKEQDCIAIQCEGRKGWKSVLLPLGYTEDSVVYIKEVKKDELPDV